MWGTCHHIPDYIKIKLNLNEGELDKGATISKMEIVRKKGNRNINRKLEFYNLYSIISGL